MVTGAALKVLLDRENIGRGSWLRKVMRRVSPVLAPAGRSMANVLEDIRTSDIPFSSFPVTVARTSAPGVRGSRGMVAPGSRV
jgi:hypothetical protein